MFAGENGWKWKRGKRKEKRRRIPHVKEWDSAVYFYDSTIKSFQTAKSMTECSVSEPSENVKLHMCAGNLRKCRSSQSGKNEVPMR